MSLFADDLRNAEHDAERLQKFVSIFKTVAEMLGLGMSETKSQTQRTNNTGKEYQLDIEIEQGKLKCVDMYKYLGFRFCDDLSIQPELTRRKQAVWGQYKSLSKQFFRRKLFSDEDKSTVIKVYILTILLYACCTWTMTKKNYEFMDSIMHSMLLNISGKRRKDHTRYISLLEKYGLYSIEGTIRMTRLLYYKKVMNMGKKSLPKIILFSDIEGNRKKGKPKLTWKDNVKDDLEKFNINTENWMTIAKCDKKKWEEKVLEGLEHFEINWREERNAMSRKKYLMELPFYGFDNES